VGGVGRQVVQGVLGLQGVVGCWPGQGSHTNAAAKISPEIMFCGGGSSCHHCFCFQPMQLMLLLCRWWPFGFVSRRWHLCDVQHLQTSWRALFFYICMVVYNFLPFFSPTVHRRMGKFVFRN